MTRPYTDYLHDILHHIESAQKFVVGVELEEFLANEEKAFAVIRALEVIGEATKHIPYDKREQFPDIPWTAIAGMRDKLIHGYFGVNLVRVWETIQRHLPPLKTVIQQMLQAEGE